MKYRNLILRLTVFLDEEARPLDRLQANEQTLFKKKRYVRFDLEPRH